MVSTTDDARLVQLINEFEQAETRRADTAKALLEEVHKLKKQLHDVSQQLEMSDHTSLLRYQGFKEVQAKLLLHEERDAIDPFVLVLVDGDNYPFRDDLVIKGEEGGKEASRLIVQSLKDQFEEVCPGFRPVVSVYANLNGLANAYATADVVDDPMVVRNFFKGFKVLHDYVELVDVGVGKDEADRKLKERYELHKWQGQCKQILLACVRDGGYFRELKKDQEDSYIKQKVWIIKAAQPASGHNEVTLQGLTMDEVFRKHKLDSSYSAAATRPRPQLNRITADTSVTSRDRTATSSMHTPGQSGENGEAIATTTSAQVRPVPQNVDGQRVDRWMKSRKSESLEARRAEGKSSTPCNDHFLGAGCHKQVCEYSHDYCNEEELQALRWSARQSPCNHLNDCSNPACYFGHQCPYTNCYYGDGCKFARVHGKSTKPVGSA